MEEFRNNFIANLKATLQNDDEDHMTKFIPEIQIKNKHRSWNKNKKFIFDFNKINIKIPYDYYLENIVNLIDFYKLDNLTNNSNIIFNSKDLLIIKSPLIDEIKNNENILFLNKKTFRNSSLNSLIENTISNYFFENHSEEEIFNKYLIIKDSMCVGNIVATREQINSDCFCLLEKYKFMNIADKFLLLKLFINKILFYIQTDNDFYNIDFRSILIYNTKLQSDISIINKSVAYDGVTDPLIYFMNYFIPFLDLTDFLLNSESFDDKESLEKSKIDEIIYVSNRNSKQEKFNKESKILNKLNCLLGKFEELKNSNKEYQEDNKPLNTNEIINDLYYESITNSEEISIEHDEANFQKNRSKSFDNDKKFSDFDNENHIMKKLISISDSIEKEKILLDEKAKIVLKYNFSGEYLEQCCSAFLNHKANSKTFLLNYLEKINMILNSILIKTLDNNRNFLQKTAILKEFFIDRFLATKEEKDIIYNNIDSLYLRNEHIDKQNSSELEEKKIIKNDYYIKNNEKIVKYEKFNDLKLKKFCFNFSINIDILKCKLNKNKSKDLAFKTVKSPINVITNDECQSSSNLNKNFSTPQSLLIFENQNQKIDREIGKTGENNHFRTTNILNNYSKQNNISNLINQTNSHTKNKLFKVEKKDSFFIKNQYIQTIESLLKLKDESYKLLNEGEELYSNFQFEAANEKYELCLFKRIRAFGEENLETAIALLALAGAQLKIGKLDKSLENYLKSLSVFQNLKKEDLKIQASIMHNIGLVNDFLNKSDDSLEYYEKAAELKKICFGVENESYASTLYNIGNFINIPL